MKTLILDCDRSLASLGGEAGVERLLGVRPVPVSRGLADVKAILARLLVTERRGDDHPLLPGHEEVRRLPSPLAREMGVEALVVDTASTLADQEFAVHLARLNRRREAKNDPPVASLDQSTWGPYGDAMMGLWTALAQTEMVVVVTCHAARREDDTGVMTVEPAIRGSSGSKMLRLFDAVLFTSVARGASTGASGSAETGRAAETGREESLYRWHTRATDARPAKTRGLTLDPFVEQDFSRLVAAFRVHGTKYPKILVVGESGTGKTAALATLADA